MKNRSVRPAKHPIAIIAVISLIFIGLACTCGGGRSDQEWNRVLAYKKLSRAANSGAVSDRVNFFFCPSGDYAMQTQFSGFSGGGAGTLSMASEDVELGRWAVKNGVLYLRSQNGGDRQYDLSVGSDDDVIRLNGDGYLVDTQNECE